MALGNRALGYYLLTFFFPLCYFCIFVFTLLNLFFPLFLLPLCVYFYFYLQGLLFFEIPNSFGNMFLAQGRWSICVKCYIPVTGCSSWTICRENGTFCGATKMPFFLWYFLWALGTCYLSYQAHSVPWVSCFFLGQFLLVCKLFRKSRKPSPKVGHWL